MLWVYTVGEGVERMGQPPESRHLILQGGEDFGSWIDDSISQPLEVAVQVGERRAQLVGEVQDQVAALALLVLEACGHLVERVRDRRELWRLRPLHSGVIASLRNASRGARELIERSLDHPAEHDRQDQGAHHSEHRTRRGRLA